MKTNQFNLNAASIGFVALSMVASGSMASDSFPNGGDDVRQSRNFNKFKEQFESPTKQIVTSSQARDDVMHASPAIKGLAKHLDEEAEALARKRVEAAEKKAQADVEEIQKRVKDAEAEGEIRIQQIRQTVAEEQERVDQLKAAQRNLEEVNERLMKKSQDLEAKLMETANKLSDTEARVQKAEEDALLTKTGVKNALSYANPFAYNLLSIDPRGYFNNQPTKSGDVKPADNS